MRPVGLIVACALSAIVVAEAAVFRVAVTPGDAPLPDRALVVLIAAACLIVAVLALPRARALAWAAATLAAGFAAIEVVAAVIGLGPFSSGEPWRDLSALATIALLVAASTALGFAARGLAAASRVARGAVVLLAAAVLVVVAVSIWTVGLAAQATGPGNLAPLRVAARIGIAAIVAGFLLGATRSLWPAFRTAFGIARNERAADGARLWTFLSALADELLPGRVAGRNIAAESERARLAADLHALVLPDLRRAAA